MFKGVIGRSEDSRVRMAVSALVSIMIGILALSYPIIISGILASTYLTLLIGISIVDAGAAHIFSRSGNKHSLPGIILGVFYIIFGAAVIFNRLIPRAVIVLLLPFWALLAGGSGVLPTLQRSTVSIISSKSGEGPTDLEFFVCLDSF